jgi:hypothetical protein
MRIIQLAREGSLPPGLRLSQAELSRKSNQLARARIRQFESDMPSQAVQSLWGVSDAEKYARHSGASGYATRRAEVSLAQQLADLRCDAGCNVARDSAGDKGEACFAFTAESGRAQAIIAERPTRRRTPPSRGRAVTAGCVLSCPWPSRSTRPCDGWPSAAFPPSGAAGTPSAAAEATMSYRAAAGYASLAIFVATVRMLIDRGVLSKRQAAEVLDEAEAMLAQDGGAASNRDAIELLRTDIRERIGLTTPPP